MLNRVHGPIRPLEHQYHEQFSCHGHQYVVYQTKCCHVLYGILNLQIIRQLQQQYLFRHFLERTEPQLQHEVHQVLYNDLVSQQLYMLQRFSLRMLLLICQEVLRFCLEQPKLMQLHLQLPQIL